MRKAWAKSCSTDKVRLTQAIQRVNPMSGLVRLICRKEKECRVFDIPKVEAANVKKRLLKTEWVIEDEITL